MHFRHLRPPYRTGGWILLFQSRIHLRKPLCRKPCVDASRCARKILTFLACDRVRSCVRPLCAAFHMPRAGMEIRGSGPNQLRRAQVGALASPGFPDLDLIDHLPMQVIAFLTLPGGGLRQGSISPHHHRSPVFLLFRQHGPKTARHLVGQGDGDQHAWLAGQHFLQP